MSLRPKRSTFFTHSQGGTTLWETAGHDMHGRELIRMSASGKVYYAVDTIGNAERTWDSGTRAAAADATARRRAQQAFAWPQTTGATRTAANTTSGRGESSSRPVNPGPSDSDLRYGPAHDPTESETWSNAADVGYNPSIHHLTLSQLAALGNATAVEPLSLSQQPVRPSTHISRAQEAYDKQSVHQTPTARSRSSALPPSDQRTGLNATSSRRSSTRASNQPPPPPSTSTPNIEDPMDSLAYRVSLLPVPQLSTRRPASSILYPADQHHRTASPGMVQTRPSLDTNKMFGGPSAPYRSPDVLPSTSQRVASDFERQDTRPRPATRERGAMTDAQATDRRSHVHEQAGQEPYRCTRANGGLDSICPTIIPLPSRAVPSAGGAQPSNPDAGTTIYNARDHPPPPRRVNENDQRGYPSLASYGLNTQPLPYGQDRDEQPWYGPRPRSPMPPRPRATDGVAAPAHLPPTSTRFGVPNAGIPGAWPGRRTSENGSDDDDDDADEDRQNEAGSESDESG